MSTSCLICCLKHLGTAYGFMIEALLGYPAHQWLAVGQLALAEQEVVFEHFDLAIEIREHRLLYQDDAEYRVPIESLITKCVARLDTVQE